MISLFLLTLAGIAARLKPTVTTLLQGPLQGLRAPARLGDATAKTPPPCFTPVKDWGMGPTPLPLHADATRTADADRGAHKWRRRPDPRTRLKVLFYPCGTLWRGTLCSHSGHDQLDSRL